VGYLEARASGPPGSWKSSAYAHFRRFEQRFGLVAESIVVVHQRIAGELKDVYGFHGRVRVAPNAIVVVSEREPRRSYESGFMILWVGQVTYRKGLDLVIGACQLAKATISDLRLLLVGVQPSYIPDFVIPLGRISPDKVGTIYAGADIFLCPSRYEGFPIVLLEAMAAGLPIVASDAAGRGIIEPGRNGYLVSGESAGDYANAIIDLWRSQQVRMTMSLNNLEDVRRFDWEQTASAYVAAGREALVARGVAA